MILRYDGTFAGFLSTVALARERGAPLEAITDREPDQQGLFTAVEVVATARDRAEELYRLMSRTLPS
ncbi:DNA metabolism protein, partial [bacterium]|nr:DNA metabolism protein [bacterium]